MGIKALVKQAGYQARHTWQRTKTAIVRTGKRLLPQARYESAAVSKRTSDWVTAATDSNKEIGTSLPKTRDRTRALGRDNPWGKRAVQAIVTNTVGDGIRAQWNDPAVQAAWDRWFGSRQIDADGMLDGYAMTALALKSIVESGEVLVRKRPRSLTDGLDIPLQVQLLEGDLLDLNKTEELATGGEIEQGVQKDAIGRRTAYWLFPRHPGGLFTLGYQESRPYAAANFAHVYRLDRPAQVRGMPWGTGSVLTLRNLASLEDAQLERQRKSACFMAFRRTPDIGLDALPDASDLLSTLEPGAIEDLPPGWDMTFATPPQPEDDERLKIWWLRGVAADYGIPYEALTGDLSQGNFSSNRMGANEFMRNIDIWRWQLIVPRLLNPIVDWFREAAALTGLNVIQEYPLWTAPARVMVDNTREVPAMIKAIRAGLISTPQAIRSQGYDPDTLLAEEAAWRAKAQAVNVILDSDPGADAGRQPAPTAGEQAL